jgi:hypothetical protein
VNGTYYTPPEVTAQIHGRTECMMSNPPFQSDEQTPDPDPEPDGPSGAAFWLAGILLLAFIGAIAAALAWLGVTLTAGAWAVFTLPRLRDLPDDAPCSAFAPVPVGAYRRGIEDHEYDKCYFNPYSVGSAQWREYEAGWRGVQEQEEVEL